MIAMSCPSFSNTWRVCREPSREFTTDLTLAQNQDLTELVDLFDSYPLPQLDDMLGRLVRAWKTSTIDLTKGY